LRSNRDLDKDKIGEFIGGHLELNIKVLSEFTDLLDFTGMPVDEAMRYFLEQFTLLGESQIVDRIVQKFGQKY
jgi:brefeldin A-inhibited guanine nucleotide-exchange protein